MSKTYILQKDWFYAHEKDSNGTVYKAGEKLTKRSHYKYYEFSNHVIVNEQWVENNPEWFLPEENKSNDSFQWTDEIAEEYAKWCMNKEHRGWGNMNSFKKLYQPKPQAENKQYEIMYFNGEQYILGEAVVGKPAFLRSSEGNCRQAVVAALNTTNHWMCDPIGLVASSDKSLGLPSIEEYAKSETKGENKPDWEIVDGKCTKEEGGRIGDIHPWHKVACVRGECEIYRVRRLSDGLVFSVGDEVVHKTDGLINTAKILKFIIPETIKNKMWFEFEEGKDYVKDLANFDKLPPQPQKQESSCKSPSGNCVNHLACNREDKCIYEAREENQWAAAKEISFKRVLKTLKHNKVMVDTRDDGIYIRLAGGEDKGEAFTLHWANAYPFEKTQDHIGIDRNGEDTKKERIEVRGFHESGASISNTNGRPFKVYEFNCDERISAEKIPAIKQAIELVLNDDKFDRSKKPFTPVWKVDRSPIDEELNWPKPEAYMSMFRKAKEEQEINVDEPLGITMREIASCITNYVRKSGSPILPDSETTVIDHKKLEEICKTKMRKMFTQQQVDAMCEDAFNAARVIVNAITSKLYGTPEKRAYKTFQDYKNHPYNKSYNRHLNT